MCVWMWERKGGGRREGGGGGRRKLASSHARWYISGPLQARTQSLEATVYTRTILVGPHHKAHQHCCVNWWLGGYGIADCKGHAMHCTGMHVCVCGIEEGREGGGGGTSSHA